MKTERIVIKCTAEEKQMIQKRAEQIGMGFSAYLRMLALNDIAKQPPPPHSAP